MANNPLDLNRVIPEIDAISQDAQMMAQSVTRSMNAASVMMAIQLGYRMACEDNGLPVPAFDDPKAIFGVQG